MKEMRMYEDEIGCWKFGNFLNFWIFGILENYVDLIRE